MNRRSKQIRRFGSIGLMLVLMLALLVGTFAVSVARRASNERHHALHHQSIMALESAIEAVEQFNPTPDSKLRLPLDQNSNRWILVESVGGPDTKRQYQATLYHNDQPGLSIQRLARSDT
ncbi:hypothetical protein NZK35_24670 [Stieleria sp. ICT_E10.1]|uniref:hypothetical protein n=1 Tax=Stieleria sedimenti TaxID=2976331 RepID=UPI0021803D0F|nr:hypothetical protein [Stieleria sedimenti]MCS7469858.1 hypothetical protein [Stieleria sedimenti]